MAYSILLTENPEMSVPWTSQRGWNWFSWSTTCECNRASDKVSNSGIIEDTKI